IYHPLALLHSVLDVQVTVVSPWVRAVRTDAGWQLPALAGGNSGLTVRLRRLEVHDGRLGVELPEGERTRRLAVRALEVDASGRLENGRRELRVAKLAFVPRGIDVSAVTVAGTLATEGEQITLDAARIVTARSRVTASGRLHPGTSIEGSLALTPLAAREVRA